MNVVVRVGTELVHGVEVDFQTRCAHYRGAVDVVAIRFHCCQRWYPCLHCHAAIAQHPIRPWPPEATDTLAVLCGVCASTLAIGEYRDGDRCPRCAAPFNAGCAVHHPVYFA